MESKTPTLYFTPAALKEEPVEMSIDDLRMLDKDLADVIATVILRHGYCVMQITDSGYFRVIPGESHGC